MSDVTPSADIDAVPPWDVPWTFTVTWDPEKGALPAPILRLFRHRSTITPGEAALATDEGHATYYVKAVTRYLDKYQPGRVDVQATARVTPPGKGAP